MQFSKKKTILDTWRRSIKKRKDTWCARIGWEKWEDDMCMMLWSVQAACLTDVQWNGMPMMFVPHGWKIKVFTTMDTILNEFLNIQFKLVLPLEWNIHFLWWSPNRIFNFQNLLSPISVQPPSCLQYSWIWFVQISYQAAPWYVSVICNHEAPFDKELIWKRNFWLC